VTQNPGGIDIEMTILLLTVMLCACMLQLTNGFQAGNSRNSQRQFKMVLNMNNFNNIMMKANSMMIADTSISEEDIIDVTGQVSELPDPIFIITIGTAIIIGAAILQFSLGDLTKEEGQARVKDFLQTKRDTERKRGYFD
jgi:multisubunit Na+/H+ antiporter MnhC subunit